MNKLPTVVLLHGAITDASVWSAVAAKLQNKGFSTIAPAMPMRGLRTDAAYLSAFLDTLNGPHILVGHSYGGSVISHPMVAKKDLHGLVFVAAFIPDAGETAGELNGRWPGSKFGEATTIVRTHPDGQELYLKPEAFAEVYAADLTPEQTRILAAAQRPIDLRALGESFEELPTWRKTPSWAIVSANDASIPPEAQRWMAKRANATIIELNASHAAPISQSDAVAGLIEAVAKKPSAKP